MNKKLIMLVLSLPLILMICLFSVSNTIRVAISIPVSKIEIISDNIVYMNFDNGERYTIDYTVYPTNAKNKEVYFETEAVGNAPLAELEYIDGQIVAKTCGKAKVYLTTVDGGFRDSFIVQVESVKLHSIECDVDKPSIYVGETAQITTYFVPENSATLLTYNVKEEDEHIISVSPSGIITGISKGIAEIEVVSEQYSDVKDIVTIEIKNKDILDLESDEIVTWNKQGSVRISLDTEEECEYTYTVVDEYNQTVGSSVIDVQLNLTNESDGRISLDYLFVNNDFNGDIFVTITAQTAGGLTVSKTCKISCVNKISAQFESGVIKGVAVGKQSIEPFKVTPADASVRFECEASNDNVSVEIKNNLPYITARKLGVSTIIVKIYNADNAEEFVEISKDIVVTTSGMSIEENANTYGIENVFAFAKTEVDGTVSNFGLTLSYGKFKINDIFEDVEAGDNFVENITWVSSSTNASIDKSGRITLAGTNIEPEMVKFKAVFEYQGVKFESDEFTIQCIYNGVNVRSYKDLWKATNEASPKPIVLHNDIKDDFAIGVDRFYKEIATTYDKTYYKNIGSEDKAKIKVLIEFKTDVYGNGHIINAHNVAWKLNLENATTNAVFKGPLNFVAMSENGGMVSVKAQDNVCFAVYKDVTLTNIELKGCDLQADSNNEYDLTDLTYTGTVVEVFGDNVNIQYSRITNGRTVLRAFGDIEDSSKVIHLNIQNSILSGAREFIMRLGSNCFVEGTKEQSSPRLPGDDNITFPAQKEYELMDTHERQIYDNAYIKTFVNVKNSVFKDAGIFAIALDTHFSGPALEDGSGYLGGLVSDWKDLAKTSYGVKLTFEGDVKMYCWTDINTIDSSTLIETHELSAFKDIEFNVGEMVETISKNEKFSDIIVGDTTKYVHANIAFFGGGKNYSVFEGFNDYGFNGYEIKLSDVNKTMLQAAAGNESFYFLLNDANTQNFLPEDQEEILKTKDAYSCIYNK